MSDEDALYEAGRLTDLRAKVLLAFKPGYGWSYVNLAMRLGLARNEVRDVGQYLRSLDLAPIQPARLGGEFHGAALHLNKRGWQVCSALKKLRGLDQEASVAALSFIGGAPGEPVFDLQKIRSLII